VGIAPFEPWHAFDSTKGGKVLGKTHEQLFAKISVRNLPAAELDDGLDSVAFLQKSDGVVLFEAVVVVVGIRTEFEFLDLHDVLLLLGVVLLLLLLVLIVTVVDSFGDRRHGSRRNEDKIEPHLLSFT